MSSRLNIFQKVRSLFFVTVGGFGVFTAYNIYNENEKFYKEMLLPALYLLPPERAHNLAIFATKAHLLPKSTFQDPDILKTNLFGRALSNPVGIAAGYDKHGEAIEGLHDMGFGFIEIGSVTPYPQPGNKKPRLFRLSRDKAVINRYGFNSEGHRRVYERVAKLKFEKDFKGYVGINLGKNLSSTDPAFDYVEGIRKFSPVADYLVVNVSSPNTPGLTSLQAKEELSNLLRKINNEKDQLSSEKKPPLLLKLSPDLTYEELVDIADVIKKKASRVDGLIIANTTTERSDTLKTKDLVLEKGGLSGKPLKDRATQMIADMYLLSGGMTIIGVGGIFNGQDAYEKIRAGAKAVQIYTSLVYEGPLVVTKIKKELAQLLDRDGYRNVNYAVGVDTARSRNFK